MTGIYVAHTPAQTEQASTLVDLLESSLSLDESGIRCSTLPGYATTRSNGEGLRADIGGSQAVIALVDDHALRDPQLMLELGVAFTYDKRMMLLVEGAERGDSLPGALRELSLVERIDGNALVSMVEDLAFELGLRPRLGEGAQEAIRQLSTAPPPADEVPTVRPVQAHMEAADVEVPKAAPVPQLDAQPQALLEVQPGGEHPPEPLRESEPDPALSASPERERHDSVEEIQLEDDDLWMVDDEVSVPGSIPAPTAPTPAPTVAPEVADAGPQAPEPLPAPSFTPVPEPAFEPVSVQESTSCVEALEAGRAISECSFHREAGGNFASELEGSFGRFVDSVGGSWDSLRHLADVDVWLAATDNLLEGLRTDQRYAADWYELGYQFSTLRSIAEGGMPADPDDYPAYAEIWQQSLDQFWRSADCVQIPPEEVVRVRSMLENLLGPENERDYTNLVRSLETLKGHAETADKQRRWFG
ncbi:MAG: hypothetical protein OXT09_28925 [Myxococcales bacterium]|nr:hypothetical protein [Myxococcales bacterium]